MRRFVAPSSGCLLRDGSIRSCSQRFCTVSCMCMYSGPILPQYVSRSVSRMSRSFAGLLAAQAAADEVAVEVPDREAVELRIELGMLADLVLERIEVGEQMTAHAVGVDHLQRRGFARDDLVGRSLPESARRWRSFAQRAGS